LDGFCWLEGYYAKEFGLPITWGMPPAIEDYLNAARRVVILMVAPQEDKLCASWREQTAAAWGRLTDAAQEVREVNLNEIRFDGPFDD
jgi:hypothetical protein